MSYFPPNHVDFSLLWKAVVYKDRLLWFLQVLFSLFSKRSISIALVLCQCTHVGMCLWVNMHIHSYMWKPEVDVRYLLQALSTFWDRVSIEPELTIHSISWLVSFQDPAASTSLVMSNFYIGARNMNSGPHICLADILPTETSLQLPRCLL